jgi:GNAT superfamily N-acetyltransferase
VGPDLFTVGALRAIELSRDDLPALQRFFEANSDYFHAVQGHGPSPDEALHALEDDPPPEMPFGRKWLLSFLDGDGELRAIAHLCSDFLAPGVWLLGLFIVASERRGTGVAAEVYEAVEAWARDTGARWIRLGVVVGNARAERFWRKVGYTEVRRRTGVEMGRRVNTLSVMYKALAGGSRAEYLALVARDRPETP